MMLSNDKKYDILVTCPPGLYPWIQEQLLELNLPLTWAGNTGVETRGTFLDAIRLNMMLRCGHRVLLRLFQFECTAPQMLYEKIFSLPWHEIIPPTGYISVTSTVFTPTISDTRYANLKVKDAIVDRLSREYGKRPDSGPKRKGLVFHLYWKAAKASIYLDTSGKPLSHRGYRKVSIEAPMQETLAAAVIMATNWKQCKSFINPMCGSGTLAIEIALIAAGKYPGLIRNDYGFIHLKNFDCNLYDSIKKELINSAKKIDKSSIKIIASDINPKSIDAAYKNAKSAGVERLIEFYRCDFSKTPIPSTPATVILNPPYGIRLGSADNLEKLYNRIGKFFKEKCVGSSCYIFTSNKSQLIKQIGLKYKYVRPFLNGRIKCGLYHYLP